MCVPFTSPGRNTDMSMVATEGCGPSSVSTMIGCLIARTPTRWMAMLRLSARDCSSGKKSPSGAFMMKRSNNSYCFVIGCASSARRNTCLVCAWVCTGALVPRFSRTGLDRRLSLQCTLFT